MEQIKKINQIQSTAQITNSSKKEITDKMFKRKIKLHRKNISDIKD